MKDIPRTFGNISKKIMQILTSTRAPRIDIIFDQYFSPSIKDYERAKRNEQDNMEFIISGPEQVRPTDFTKELQNIKFKDALVNFLIEHWASDEMVPFKRLKNYDASNLPPCKAELHQQLLRTQYITSIWRNAHLKFPSSLTPQTNGWIEDQDKYHFHWFDDTDVESHDEIDSNSENDISDDGSA
ncbi:hypothetical protein X777_04800, partial [Ooceraea biroi]